MKKILFLLVPSIIFMIFISVSKTYSLFSDSAISASNTFTAADVFPTITPTPTITGIANHLLISEVQTATAGATTSDFVELYNPTNQPIDLDGHRLVRRNNTATIDTNIKSWSSSTIIPSHSFYLWASTDGGYNQKIEADTSTGTNVGNNSSVAIRLGSLNTGMIVDAVNWSNNINALSEGTKLSNLAGGQSWERKAISSSTQSTMTSGGSDELKGNGYDTNNNSLDFVLRLIAQPQNSNSSTEQP